MARLADLAVGAEVQPSGKTPPAVPPPRLLALAAGDVVAGGGAGPSPVVARTAEGDPATQISRLWLLILRMHDTRVSAWHLLRLWVMAGDEHPELTGAKDKLLAAIEAEPDLAAELAFHLRFWRYRDRRRDDSGDRRI
jgi:hypothetical protein